MDSPEPETNHMEKREPLQIGAEEMCSRPRRHRNLARGEEAKKERTNGVDWGGFKLRIKGKADQEGGGAGGGKRG